MAMSGDYCELCGAKRPGWELGKVRKYSSVDGLPRGWFYACADCAIRASTPPPRSSAQQHGEETK